MKSVGQPKKNIIDALQTIFWYRYLETGIVAKIFEKEFSEFCLENKIDITSLEVEDRISLLENFQSSKLNSKEITFTCSSFQLHPGRGRCYDWYLITTPVILYLFKTNIFFE